MANEESKKENPENQTPTEEEQPVEGLTADEAVDAAYNPQEVFDNNKSYFLVFCGVILLGVAGFSFFNKSEQDEEAQRSLRYLEASAGMEGAEERFLAFSNDYQDSLGGLAQYQAAVVQYKDERYAEAAQNFKTAGDRLAGNPLQGRALLGYAVSVIKTGEDLEAGKKALQSLSANSSLLPTDRAEASFLMALQALAEDDEENYSKYSNLLSADENSSYFFSRLEELKRTKKFLKVADSLPEINADKGAKFLAENKQRKEVEELESGLQYQVINEGNGTKNPQENDQVEVHYRGTLINGETFDSSIDRGEPASFKVNEVIKGWTEALQLMKEGDKWKLFIPSEIAYGENGSNSIGPNETLIFDVELLSIIPSEQPELTQESNSTLDQILPLDVDANTSEAILESNVTEKLEENASK